VRRVVRITEDFWADLDRQLPAERGPDGEPSARDFEATDLLTVVDVFAEQWDTLARHIGERGDYREWSGPGTVVYAIAVVGQLARDGSVELVSIEIDTEGL
jgi:hypothetical protein